MSLHDSPPILKMLWMDIIEAYNEPVKAIICVCIVRRGAGLHEPIIEEFERYPAPPEVIYGK
jgi:hypothetical protein